MFVFHAGRCLEAIRWFRPESAAGLERIAQAWGTPQQASVLAEVYPSLPKISVDYGLMEPASADSRRTIVEVPMNVNWKDVGSWPTWAETLPADVDGNRSNSRTEHLASTGVVVASDDPNHVVSVVGLENVIVVRTATATLVCRADMAEKVKEIAGRVPPDVQ
jgi:mannose-1-phosphate guanylyltransferase